MNIKSIIVLLLLALSARDGVGQITFEQHNISFELEGVRISSVDFSDIDGDGDQDVLITGHSYSALGTAKLYTNNGSGVFSLVSGTPFVGVNYGSVDFSDIDGDGDQDVLITGADSSNLRTAKLYTNNGSGVFSLVSGTPFDGVYNSSVAFSDIDGDGDEDVLITGSSNSGQISKLYSNNGSGVFTLVTGTPFDAVSEGSVAFSDIDGDGDQDVLITGANSSNLKIPKLYTNNGSGVFTLVSSTPFDGVYYGSVDFSDIDGDGDEDVLITGLNNSNLRTAKLYTNNGSGVFSLVSGTPFDAVTNSSVAFSDVDGDGDEDVLITGSSNSGKISKLYTNNGSGVFTLVTGTPFVGVYAGSVAFSDIDGDGDEDVLITGENSSKLYLNDSSGNYEELFLGNIMGYTTSTSDIDGDGDKDILINGRDIVFNSSTFKLLRYIGAGRFTVVAGTPFLSVSSGTVDFSDIDGDGDEDLLITGSNSSSQTIAILYTNNGSGVFSLVSGTPFVGVKKSSVAFSDIDGDGDQDVLINGYNSSSQTIAKLYTNNGSGIFTLVTGTPFVGVERSSVDFSDIDGDGDQDVLITGYNSSGIISKLYTNNGSGVFTLVTGTPFDAVTNSSVAFSDVDGDGDEDVLITGSSNSGKISKLYTNNGSGVFTLVTGTPFFGVAGGHVAFSDVDGDGDEDVLLLGRDNTNNDRVILYENDGTGVFTALSGTSFVLGRSYSVVFADIDNDGDDDLFIGGDSARCYINNTCDISRYRTLELCENTYTLSSGDLLSQDSIYLDTVPSLFGCDIYRTSNITLGLAQNDTNSYNACIGSGVRVLDKTYTQSGFYRDTTTNTYGCEQIINTDLTFIHQRDTLKPIICKGTSYSNAKSTYDTEGVYYDSITYTSGCEAYVVTDLKISDPAIQLTNLRGEACGNDATATATAPDALGPVDYVWRKESFSIHSGSVMSGVKNGNYTVESRDQQGCTDIVDLTLSDVNSDKVYLTNLAFYDKGDVAGTPFQEYFGNLPNNLNKNFINPLNLLNPGNYVRFKIECQNSQESGQSIVSGKCIIRTNDPYLTIVDSSSGLNNIAWGERAWSTDEFEVLVDPSAPKGYEAVVEFVVQEGANEWTTACIPIPLTPLDINRPACLIDDDNNPDSRGNDNDKVEPNEIIEFLPFVDNVSELNAELVRGRLANLDNIPEIKIWNNRTGISGNVVDESWWNYAFNQPNPIIAGNTNMQPQFDFVFDYNYSKVYEFDLHLLMGGGFKLFGNVDTALVMWSTPYTFNEGDNPAPGCGSFAVSVSGTRESSAGEYNGTVTANPTNGAEPYRYDWNTGDTTKKVDQLTDGTYTVRVTDNQGCITYGSKKLDANSTSSSKMDNKSKLTIYPNPTQGGFSIKGLPTGGSLIKITNTLGQEILSANATGDSHTLSIYAKGLFYVSVYQKNGVVIAQQKVIVL